MWWSRFVLHELLFGHPMQDEDEVDEKQHPNGRRINGGFYSPCLGCIQTLPPGCEDDPELVALARFAVAEHNKKTNAAVEFERLVKVRHQGVAGLLHYFTIEAKEGKLYRAIVWERPWEDYTGLQDFKPVGNSTLYERLRYLCTYQIPAWHQAAEELERIHRGDEAAK